MQDILLFMQQHWALTTALVIVLTALFIIELIKIKQSTNRLTPAEATQLINHQNAVVVDIRLQDAFLAGHILDAISVPLRELEENTKKLDKHKQHPIIVVCATGTESPRAATLLTKHGFKTHLLAGGIQAWRRAEMPLIKKVN